MLIGDNFMFSHYFYAHFIIHALFLIGIFFAHPSNLLASENQPSTDSALITGMLSLRIEGVSLDMSQTEIQAKLQAAGYAQVSTTTFIKEMPLLGGRQSIYRIEFEHTPSVSKLGYFRSESGGRNKSPATESRSIPEQEAKWANELYELVCSRASDEIKLMRACEPVSESSIRFGEGNPLVLSPSITAQLVASASSMSLSIIHHKQ